MAIKLGAAVRQIVKPIEGVVDDYSMDKTDGTVLVHVQYTDKDGQPAARFFREEEVEVVAEPEDVAAVKDVVGEDAVAPQQPVQAAPQVSQPKITTAAGHRKQ